MLGSMCLQSRLCGAAMWAAQVAAFGAVVTLNEGPGVLLVNGIRCCCIVRWVLDHLGRDGWVHAVWATMVRSRMCGETMWADQVSASGAMVALNEGPGVLLVDGIRFRRIVRWVLHHLGRNGWVHAVWAAMVRSRLCGKAMWADQVPALWAMIARLRRDEERQSDEDHLGGGN